METRQAATVDNFIPFLPPPQNFTRTRPGELQVVLDGNQYFYIIGQCYLQVLEGAVELNGFRAVTGPKLHFLCSPKCYSLLPIVNVMVRSVVQLTPCQNGLGGIQGMQGAFAGCFSHSAEQPEDLPGCWIVKQPLKECRLFEVTAQWNDIALALTPATNPIIFVCGKQKGGKSSFCRYLTNRLLNVHERVILADLDLGQTEFTPPGYVAMDIITEALLSPPFANICRKPAAQEFVGFISPNTNPRTYLETSELIIDQCRSSATAQSTPIVINMMGWLSGLGFNLLAHILHYTRPTHILAIGDLQDDFVARALYANSTFPRDMPYKPDEPVAVAYIAPVGSKATAQISPADSRSLMYWAYFHYLPMTLNYDFAMPISSQRPFVVSTRILQLHFMKLPNDAATWPLLNCALVSIGWSSSARLGSITRGCRLPRIQHHAMGFIRGVDPTQQLLYVLCPLPLDAISQCNVIVVGFMNMPPGLISKGERYDGPYFSFQSAMETSGFDPRKVRHNLIRSSTANPNAQ